MNTSTPLVSVATLEQRSAAQVGKVSTSRYWGQGLTILIVLTWAASLVIGFRASLVVITILGFGAAILGLRRPALGLFGVAILSTIDAPASVLLLTGGALRWNTFNYWLLLVMLLALPFLLRLRDPHTRLLQFFILLLGLQLFISPSRTSGIVHLLGIVTSFGLLVYFASNLEDREMWYWLGIVVGTLAGAGGLSFFLQLDRLPPVNPNAWAFFPLTGLFAICLSFPFAAAQTRGQLTLALLAIVNLAFVNFVWLVLSASRGALLIAIFCLGFLVLEMRSLTRRVVFIIVGVLLVLTISTQFSNLQAYALKRVNLLVDPTTSLAGRTSGRSDLAIGGWHIFRRNPFGVGTGGFASEWAKLGDLGGLLTTRSVGLQKEAHSGWVKILVENGIVGILLLACYVLSFAVIGLGRARRDRTLRALGVLTTAVLAVALVSTEFQNKGLWLLVAGVTVLLHKEDIIMHLRTVAVNGRVADSVPSGIPRSA